ncbi:MAG: hypothetical protein LBE07_02755, partial [Gordonia sp. (in: high G+C Gram-positive bacteria)]|nr:hypothetical protein [Gordonia sp. (in: high G+C Gram-positive bacteria)]
MPPSMTPAAREAAVARLHRRARTVINGFSTGLPRYERAPTSMVEPEVVAGVHLNVDLFVRTLVTGVQPTEAEMAPIVAIAVQRHADGVAVGEIVATYQAGADLIWTAIIADAD